MGIFNSYVELPEGIPIEKKTQSHCGTKMFLFLDPKFERLKLDLPLVSEWPYF